jgi:predicted Fe-Mo cluster-binding NifX family protein
MKIAIPIWKDRISPVLDTASRLLIVEVEAQREESRFETYLSEPELPRRCIRIQGLGVDLLICGAISRPYSTLLAASGIDVIQGISGHPEDVLQAYLQGNLFDSRFLMPGVSKNTFLQKGRPSASKKAGKKTKKGNGDSKRNQRRKMVKTGGSLSNGKERR